MKIFLKTLDKLKSQNLPNRNASTIKDGMMQSRKLKN